MHFALPKSWEAGEAFETGAVGPLGPVGPGSEGYLAAKSPRLRLVAAGS